MVGFADRNGSLNNTENTLSFQPQSIFLSGPLVDLIKLFLANLVAPAIALLSLYFLTIRPQIILRITCLPAVLVFLSGLTNFIHQYVTEKEPPFQGLVSSLYVETCFSKLFICSAFRGYLVSIFGEFGTGTLNKPLISLAHSFVCYLQVGYALFKWRKFLPSTYWCGCLFSSFVKIYFNHQSAFRSGRFFICPSSPWFSMFVDTFPDLFKSLFQFSFGETVRWYYFGTLLTSLFRYALPSLAFFRSLYAFWISALVFAMTGWREIVYPFYY